MLSSMAPRQPGFEKTGGAVVRGPGPVSVTAPVRKSSPGQPPRRCENISHTETRFPENFKKNGKMPPPSVAVTQNIRWTFLPVR